MTPADTLAQIANLAAPRLPATCADNVMYESGKPRRIDGAFDRSRMPRKGEHGAYHGKGNVLKNAFEQAAQGQVKRSTMLTQAANHEPVTRGPKVVLYVSPWWNVSLGIVGYELHIPDGNYILRVKLDNPGAALVAAQLTPPLFGQHDKRRGEWRVTWQEIAGTRNETVTPLSVDVIQPMLPETHQTPLEKLAEFNAAQAPKDKTMLQSEDVVRPKLAQKEAERKRAQAAGDAKDAQRPATSDFDTFDQNVSPDDLHAALNAQAAAEEHTGAKQKVFAQYFKWLPDALFSRGVEGIFADDIRDLVAFRLTGGKSDSFKALPDDIKLATLQKATFEAIEEWKSTEEAAISRNVTQAASNASPAIGIAATPPDAPAAAAVSVASGNVSTLPQQEQPVSELSTEPTVNPYSAKFSLLNKRGVKVEFTIVAPTASDLVQRTDQMIDRLLNNEWQTTRYDEIQAMPVETPAPPQTPITTAANTGLSDCFMIKVGKSFKGDKDQVVFECSGLDDEVKFSSKTLGDILQKVAGLRKPDGAALTTADLINGAKVPVRGKVRWQRSEDSKWINVIETLAA